MNMYNICICIIYMSIHRSICFHKYVNLYICKYTFLHIYIYICINQNIFIHIHIHICWLLMVFGSLIWVFVSSTPLPRPENTHRLSWLGVSLYFYIVFNIRGTLGDIRLWVGDPSTSSCRVSLPAILRLFHRLLMVSGLLIRGFVSSTPLPPPPPPNATCLGSREQGLLANQDT